MFTSLPSLLAALAETPAGAPSGDESGPSMLFPLIAMGAIFYFLLIAPERKQRKLRQKMLDELKKGSQVVTTGGIIGKVIEVRDDRVIIQVADNTRLTMTRQAVQVVLEGDGKAPAEVPKKA